MAIRTWFRLLGATLGVAALAGASQLGVAYGLGIVRLTRVIDVATRDQWTAQLAWVAWFAMTAAVVGTLVGAWLLPRWSTADPGSGTTGAMALAAGLGAAIVVPLTMQPARTAQIAGVHPVFVIGACAALGALVGAVAAGAVLLYDVARWSVVTLGVAVWVLAIVSVVPSLAPADPLPAVRLGVFEPGFLSPGVTQRTALFTMPALALVAGALLGWRARRRDRPTLTIALTGLAGPAMLTLAYLIAGPGSGNDRYQVVPYWAAMTAAGAGVLGSVLAAVLRRAEPEDSSDVGAEAGSPPDGLPPLPRRTSDGSESAIARAGGSEADGDEPTLTDSDAVPGGRPASGAWPPDPGRPSLPGGLAVPAQRSGPPPGYRPGDSRMNGSAAVGAFPARRPMTAPEAESVPSRGRPRWWARRPNSSPDGYVTQTGEWPTKPQPAPAQPRPSSTPLGDYANDDPPPFDGFGRRAQADPAQADRSRADPAHADPAQADGSRFGSREPADPAPANRSPFGSREPAGRPNSGQHAASAAYVPAPSIPPLPPEIGEPTGPNTGGSNGSSPGTRPGRTVRPFSRGRANHAAPEPDAPGRHNAEPLTEAEPAARKRWGWRRNKPQAPETTLPAEPAGIEPPSPDPSPAPGPEIGDFEWPDTPPPRVPRSSEGGFWRNRDGGAPMPFGAPSGLDGPARGSGDDRGRGVPERRPVLDDHVPTRGSFPPPVASAPLPQPAPITPPRPLFPGAGPDRRPPAERAGWGDLAFGSNPAPDDADEFVTSDKSDRPGKINDKRRAGKQRKKDDEFVDWVSGLGGEK